MSRGRIAIAQLCSSSDVLANLELAVQLCRRAVAQDVRVLFFPEATDYIAQNAAHSRKLSQHSGVFVQRLSQQIKSLSKPLDVSIGVHLPSGSKVRNTLLYIQHDGQIIQEYDKLHLFDVAVPNGPIMLESQSVQKGDKIPRIIKTPAGSLGSSICYDIRFPELALKMRSMGAELICYPSAFTMSTGEAHWEILGRATAIQTQCFVIMPGQYGIHRTNIDPDSDPSLPNTRQSWGHSMIIDPWGKIIAQAKNITDKFEPQLIVASIDLLQLQNIREKMPLWKQRRNDIFH